MWLSVKAADLRNLTSWKVLLHNLLVAFVLWRAQNDYVCCPLPWKITLPSLANVLNFTAVSSLIALCGCTSERKGRYITYIYKVRAKTCEDSKTY